jgi:two-component system chemotaxis sensor kinase CheA
VDEDLIREFVTEAREWIEALDSEIVRFEQEPANPRLLGEVFRLIHTVKGACGFIGLNRLQAVAHAAETVLGGFRDGDVAVTGEAVSAVLETVDLVRMIIDALASTGVEPQGDDTVLIRRLEAAARPSAQLATAEPEAPRVAVAAAVAPSRPLIERLGGDATVDAAVEMCIFRLGAVLGAELLTLIDPDRLQAAIRDPLCQIARGQLEVEPLSERLAALAGEPVPTQAVETLLDAVGADLMALDIEASAVAELRALITLPESSEVESSAPSAPPPSPASAPQEPLVQDDGPGDASIAPAEAIAPVAQTIRVGVDALEHLMTVASELVLIRNQLLQLLRLDPESAFAAPLHRLNQVASELQEGVMTTRMQPINGAWAKLPRLVRDLSKDLGKSIELVLHGQDTELDRQVLELIRDPLTHMIRNAADHGVETPAERIAAGKNPAGRISLSARHEGGAIVIEMSDDGRGLNAAKIRAKAVANGLISAAQAETMGDAEARAMIFLPGFSTAAEVTSVSGRGVGMDVVRTNIEKIGGVVELSSVEGQGSTFAIRIPLTLTIVSALIVECCGERFAMPQSSVIELVSANDASGHSIEYLGGAEVLRLRDRLLPLVSLQSLLGLPPEEARREETCIIVAKVGAFTFGVIVDRVFDTEEIVVKPVASVLRHLRLYSGATILGDGAVIMILDFNGMAQEAGAGRAGAVALEAQDEEESANGADRAAILVFRAADDSLKAAPLAGVSRIEKVDTAQIEQADGRSVIQYRGRLMPVVGADGGPVVAPATPELKPLLVFTRGERTVGLMVDEIIDIVHEVLATDLAPGREGVAGSLIIAGKATELIDVDYFWRRAQDEAGSGAMGGKSILAIAPSDHFRRLFGPLLQQAGYAVTVVDAPDQAAALHDAGAVFELILADPETGKTFANVLAGAARWHGAQVVGLDDIASLIEPSQTLLQRNAA